MKKKMISTSERKLTSDLQNMIDVTLALYHSMGLHTRKEIAEASQLSYSTIQNIEMRKLSLSSHIGTLQRFANGCGLTIRVVDAGLDLRILKKPA